LNGKGFYRKKHVKDTYHDIAIKHPYQNVPCNLPTYITAVTDVSTVQL